MREILFKAKRVDNGEWVEGYYSKSPDPMFAFLKDFIFAPYFDEKTERGYDNGYMIDINTLCQYTGLTDKNGRKIWENDIIKYFWNNKENIDVVKYEAPIFTPSKSFRWNIYKDEVIGNVFDNPELLKGGAE